MKRRVVLICPGRGTYTKTELGYLRRPTRSDVADAITTMVARADQVRTARGDAGLRELDDAATFGSRHMVGENAGSLIFVCTAADRLKLDMDRVEVVAVLGNSAGWYTALHVGRVLGFSDGFTVGDTMGCMQRAGPVGGQIIHPMVDDAWRLDPARAREVDAAIADARAAGHDVGWSIRLGGFAVLYGSHEGVKVLLGRLPKTRLGEREYPFQLQGHAAFHSPLLHVASARAFAELSALPWAAPTVPLIDGRGAIWRPRSSDPSALRDWTFGPQILETFDYSAAVRVALREFAPDNLVLLGPGDSLGGATAHVIISERWRGIDSKAAFVAAQKDDPFLIAMSRPEQASRVAVR